MSTKALSNPFAALTWDDIEAWAGSTIVSRGKSYQRSNRVQKLACTASGSILAWVQGTSRYATHVEIAKKKLTASCTCPYGGTCKHAVAVVLSYLECLKNQKEIPTAAEDDPRFDLLQEAAEAAAAGHAWEPEEADDEDYDEDEEDYDDEDDDGDDDDEETKMMTTKRTMMANRRSAAAPQNDCNLQWPTARPLILNNKARKT